MGDLLVVVDLEEEEELDMLREVVVVEDLEAVTFGINIPHFFKLAL